MTQGQILSRIQSCPSSLAAQSRLTKQVYLFSQNGVGSRRNGFMPFSKALAWNETQTASSKILTWITDSSSYNSNSKKIFDIWLITVCRRLLLNKICLNYIIVYKLLVFDGSTWYHSLFDLPADHWVKADKDEKMEKYFDLSRELKNFQNLKVIDTDRSWNRWDNLLESRKENGGAED